MMLETHMRFCVKEPDFPGKFFCSKNWENGPNFFNAKIGKMDEKWAKNGFLNLFKNVVINFY